LKAVTSFQSVSLPLRCTV